MQLQFFFVMISFAVAWFSQFTLASQLPLLDGSFNLLLVVALVVIYLIPHTSILFLVMIFGYLTDIVAGTPLFHLIALSATLLPFFMIYRRMKERKKVFAHLIVSLLVATLIYEVLMGLSVLYHDPTLAFSHLVNFLPVMMMYHLIFALCIFPIFSYSLDLLHYRQVQLGTKPFGTRPFGRK